MSTCVLKALPGKLDIKRHSPSILYVLAQIYLKVVTEEQLVVRDIDSGLNLPTDSQ